MLLSDQVQTTLGKDLVADTTSETLTAVEDMQGYDGIRYVVKFGDVDAAAVLTFTPKENTASSTSSPTPTAVTLTRIAGTGATISSGAATITESSGNLDDKIVVIELLKSAMTKRYQFLSITVSAESYEIDSIITEKFNSRDVPAARHANVVLQASAAA